MLEINRLNDELKRLQRDKCQIELAKKVLNISENMCPVSFLTQKMNNIVADLLV